jgi:hypothetical protein
MRKRPQVERSIPEAGPITPTVIEADLKFACNFATMSEMGNLFGRLFSAPQR